MIKQLRLKDYILIDELTANFSNGLNIITGETGAGKSIIINAVDLAFAPRISRDVIKAGAEKAVIELVIENNRHDLTSFFAENGIDNLGTEIIITKEITPASVRTRINGTLVNTDTLRTLRTLFVDIHSQHQTYTYLQTKYHITLLDAYGKTAYGDRLDEYKNRYNKYKNLQKQLETAQNASEMTENRLEFMKFELDEIENAGITSETEDEDLRKELDVLENAEKLKELTGSSYWALNGDEGSILEALGKIKQNISKAAGYDLKLTELEQDLTDAAETLRDTASRLNDYCQDLENNTERLNQIQERLYLLDKLKRKHGGTLADVLKKRDELSAELQTIEYCAQDIEELKKQIADVEKELMPLAETISNYRKNFAQVLSVRIQDKLELLELPKTRFKINVTQKELDTDGADEVEFLISTNVSGDLKPLAKTASGGEISRVMLAIKSIFAENDDTDTVIFDEIDTGISGKAAQCIADEIVNLSKYRQILLITHQAIIAGKADKHFYVRKSQEDETIVEVYVLTGENRIKALAELAGGDINDSSVEFARGLVKQ